jgi:predicted N-acetyltransferase YhbS
MLRECALTRENKANGIRLRRLTIADLPTAHRLSRAVRWPHRIEDWQFALRLGAGYAAEIDGRVVGTALYWRFGRRHATLGMVIVAPEWQRQGLGDRLVRSALARLSDRSVLLHSTPEGSALYERLGFVKFGELRQYQGAAGPVPVSALASGERVRPLGRRDGAILSALDARAAGMPRSAVVAALLETASGIVLDREGEATGFALQRRFGRGQLIGPVVAPDAERAKALIGHWIGRRAGMFVRIDVPTDSGIADWLEGLGLHNVGPVAAMVRGPVPQRGEHARIFAAINQALG